MAAPQEKSVRAALLLGLTALAACAQPADPPGRSAATDAGPGVLATAAPRGSGEPGLERDSALRVPDSDSAGADDPPPPGLTKEQTEPGHGARIASIAMRTYIHVAPSHHSTKVGYLRAGAIVERGDQPVGTDECAGGWYRVHPRGYVCVGKGASLDLANEVVAASPRGPRRGEPFPYDYVISRKPPPPRYVRLPSAKEQRHVEGVGAEAGVSSWAIRNAQLLGPADPRTPFFEAGRDTPKPYGAEEKMRFAVHRGRAKGDSAFGLIADFEWTGRRFGLTTELDLIPIDRTNVIKPSAMRGIEIGTEGGVPAFVVAHGIGKLRPDESGALHGDGLVEFRSGWVLTGKNAGPDGGLVETTAGVWLPAEALRVATVGQDLWGHAQGGKRWIDISIEKQMLVAYEGTRPVYATLVSTGRDGMADPETTSATVQGTFFIHEKHLTATMDGDEASDDAFDLHDVPYVQYFHKGYALHAAYWHDSFGSLRSHGCVNLAPADAAWLFEWTTPVVPPEWHGAINLKSGTLVYIHG